MTTAIRADVYHRITDRIVADLEAGVRPWFRPWNAEHAAGRITRPLRANGIAYRGINVIALWMEAEAKGFAAPIWMTYRQAHELGGQVRKAERGSLVVYANSVTRTETDADTGEETESEIPFLKGYTVFCVDQIDGLPAQYYATAAPVLDPVQRIAGAEAFFAATGANIRHGGNQAYYSVTHDHVQMPPFETFRDAEAYYGTLGHECVHMTRHPTRLDRDFGRKRFGDEGYAMEELVAELGSAFLCADLGLTPEPREDHAAYIASWLKVLKDDKRAVFTAASYAQRAADLHPPLPEEAADEAAALRANAPEPRAMSRILSRPATIEIDGRRYLWREIVERRRRQIAAHDTAQARQLALFDLKDDRRPATQRTAAGRYAEPTLFAAIDRPSA